MIRETTHQFGADEVNVDQLRAEHSDLERKLEELNAHIYLTPEEQIERKRIQKLKLLKKDQIQMLVSRGGNA
ncbi:MAG: YdcH family protein [Deltaproteobacteria bacterium]|nr:YdcH family protein [Deltaproteobacteria bacterium]